MNKIFFDTNILIYTIDQRDPIKYHRARNAFASVTQSGIGVISTQVLQEFASAALTKIHQTHDEVLHELIFLEKLETIITTPKLIRRGVALAKQFQINYWDAVILAAAEEARCEQLLSEDFPDGAVYNTVRAVNPLV